MNNFYSDNIYILYQNDNEVERIVNYIKYIHENIDFDFKYELIKASPIEDFDNSKYDRTKEYSNDYLNECLKKYIDYTLNSNQVSHIRSIRKILLDAIKNNYSSITLLEYDIYFHKQIKELLPKYKNLINNCDIIYLGSSQTFWYNPINLSKIEFTRNKDFSYYKSNHSLGTFGIILKKNVFKEYLKTLELFLFSSDIVLSITSRQFTSVVLYPNLVICDISKSSILNNRDLNRTYIKFKWNIKNYILN